MLLRAIFLLLLLPAITIKCASQVRISGKVVNDATGEPITGASIYFNNTSLGTTSNNNGEFALLAERINTELIVSSIGYQLLALNISPSSSGQLKYLFRLQLKEQPLKEVLILPDATRRRWLAVFQRNFLGITAEADRSKILNLSDLYFTRGDSAGTFRAYTDTPFTIINKMLGYKVQFQLTEFSFNEETGRTYFYGYTRYEETGNSKRSKRNRQRAYTGSTMHFYRSLLANRIKEEGFELHLVKQMNNAVGETPMSMAVPVASAQLFTIDTAQAGYHRLAFDGKLMVQFNRDTPAKNYLRRKGVLVQGNLPTGFRSFLITREPYILVDKDGLVPIPLSVEYSGFWVYEKFANLLPVNYKPDN